MSSGELKAEAVASITEFLAPFQEVHLTLTIPSGTKVLHSDEPKSQRRKSVDSWTERGKSSICRSFQPQPKKLEHTIVYTA